MVDTFFELVETNKVAQRLTPFLEWIPLEEFDLDPRLLADAEITVAKSNYPYAPVNEHVEALKSATEVRALLSIVGRDAMEVAATRMMQGEAVHELVVEPGCAELLQTDPHFEDLYYEACETGRFDVFVYHGDIPFYLGILDDIVQIGVEDDDDNPRAMVETDSKEVREWAEQTYGEYREQANQLA